MKASVLKSLPWIGLSLALMTVILVFNPEERVTAMTQVRPLGSMRFEVAHNPTNEQNNQLIQEFADRVREHTDGTVNIVLEVPDHHPGQPSPASLVERSTPARWR